ncbi:hypothetical protein ACQP1K_29430 (plasmid) [Sphaerimonospora sp. CA-214678]
MSRTFGTDAYWMVDVDDVPDRRLPGRRWLFNERDLTAVEATGG